MFAYPLVFIGSFLVDCIPVVAPPAWTLMLFLMMKYDLNPWIVVTLGTMGTVSGRMVYSTFIVPYVGEKVIGKSKGCDLKYLGEKLSSRGISVFIFVFLYSLLPLSTTALFTAAGLAKVKKIVMIPPFFLGNLIGDGVLLLSGKQAVHGLQDMYKGSFDTKNIILMMVGMGILSLVIFVDWRELLEEKKLVFKWKFWQ